jgi:hypothetical protein
MLWVPATLVSGESLFVVAAKGQLGENKPTLFLYNPTVAMCDA